MPSNIPLDAPPLLTVSGVSRRRTHAPLARPPAHWHELPDDSALHSHLCPFEGHRRDLGAFLDVGVSGKTQLSFLAGGLAAQTRSRTFEAGEQLQLSGSHLGGGVHRAASFHGEHGEHGGHGEQEDREEHGENDEHGEHDEHHGEHDEEHGEEHGEEHEEDEVMTKDPRQANLNRAILGLRTAGMAFVAALSSWVTVYINYDLEKDEVQRLRREIAEGHVAGGPPPSEPSPRQAPSSEPSPRQAPPG